MQISPPCHSLKYSEQIRHRCNVETNIVHMAFLLLQQSCIAQPILLQKFCDFIGYGNLLTKVIDAFHYLCVLPLDNNNAVFNLCCRLCSAYERKAFLDGLQYGAELMLELGKEADR